MEYLVGGVFVADFGSGVEVCALLVELSSADGPLLFSVPVRDVCELADFKDSSS